VAVIVLVPGGSALVEKLACPPQFTVTVPRVVVPAVNVTVPVIFAVGLVIVAVNFTG
jgi:hypothetical protein